MKAVSWGHIDSLGTNSGLSVFSVRPVGVRAAVAWRLLTALHCCKLHLPVKPLQRQGQSQLWSLTGIIAGNILMTTGRLENDVFVDQFTQLTTQKPLQPLFNNKPISVSLLLVFTVSIWLWIVDLWLFCCQTSLKKVSDNFMTWPQMWYKLYIQIGDTGDTDCLSCQVLSEFTSSKGCSHLLNKKKSNKLL